MWYLAFSSRTLLAPFLPMIKSEYLISHAITGGLYLFVAAGQAVGYLYAGTVAARIGSKNVIIIGFFAAAGALWGMYASHGYSSLALWLFIFGVSGALYLPCAIPILTHAFDREHWGRAIGFHETAAGFSILTMPYIVATLFVFMPWRSAFLVFGAIFLIITPLFWAVSPDSQARQSEPVRILTTLKRPDLWFLLALWTISAMGAMGVYNVLPLFLVDERSFSVESANRLLSISRIGGFSGQLLIGFFLDRFNTGRILFRLTLLSALTSVGLGLAASNAVLIVMLFLQATFCVTFFPVGIFAMSKLTTAGERGVYSGIIMSISTIVGLGLAPFILGFIADVWSFQYGFALLGVMTLFALLPAQKLCNQLTGNPPKAQIP